MSNPAQAEYDSIFSSNKDRPSGHPEDSSSRSDDSSSHDGTTLHDDHDPSLTSSKPSTAMPTATYLPHISEFDANTGPKGVIADARSFESAKKRSFRQTLYAFASGESPPIFSKWKDSNSNKENREKSQSKSPSPDVSDEEEEFMQTWRANRLAQLSTMNQEGRNTRRQSPSKRRYGTVVNVDPAGYLDAIEKVSSDTVVVVLIYDDESAVSNQVEDTLKFVARKHVNTRFVKLHVLDAEMDEIAAPGILAYKGGDCFANLVSVVNEIPAGRDVNSEVIENLLLQYKII